VNLDEIWNYYEGVAGTNTGEKILRCSMCGLPRQVPNGRFLCACDAVGEFNSERVVRTPEHAALADATVMGSDPQRKLVWDAGRPHASDFRAAIRKVAHNTWTGQFAVIDRRGRVPLNPHALAPLGWLPFERLCRATNSRCGRGVLSRSGRLSVAAFEVLALVRLTRAVVMRRGPAPV
jgi:hypothetical protein